MSAVPEQVYVVEVGADPGDDGVVASRFHGPLSHDNAVAMADHLNHLWAEVPEEDQDQGRPFTRIYPLVRDAGPASWGNIARSWYREDDDFE